MSNHDPSYQSELTRAQIRRCSNECSSTLQLSEDDLGTTVNPQHGSASSGGSMEEMTTFSTLGLHSNSPVGASATTDGAVGNNIGSTGLVAVPEENENYRSENTVSSGENKQNPA